MNIKERFNSLKGYQIGELYILSLLLFLSLYLYKEELFFSHLQSSIQLQNTTNCSNAASTPKTRSNTLLTEFLNEQSSKYNISFDNLKMQGKALYLTTKGGFGENLNFIHMLNRHMELLELKIENNDEETVIFSKYGKSHFYETALNPQEIKNIQDPFTLKGKLAETKQKEEPFIIKGIILDNVNINGKWYKKNSVIGNKKIINIKINEIEIQDLDKNTIRKLYVYKEL